MIIMSERLFNKLFTDSVDVKVKSGDETFRASMSINIGIHRQECQKGNIIFPDIDPPQWGNYFDNRKGLLTYHAGKSNQQYTPDGKWKKEGRQVAKPSKFVKHIMKEFGILHTDIPSDVLPKMENRFLELTANKLKVSDFSKIQVSDDPGCIYELYTSNCSCGTLGSSCMRRESDYNCKNYADFYADMGTKIIYMTDGRGDLLARALLWEKCEDTDGNIFSFVDRIYGTEEDTETIKEWAHDNGYAHKVEQSYSTSTLVFPDGRKITKYSYLHQCDLAYREGYPFVDTLYYLTIRSNHVILDTDEGDMNLQNCDGHEMRISCYNCGCSIDEDDAIFAEDGEIYCDECASRASDGCYYPNSELRWSSCQQEYFHRCDAVFVEDIADYVSNDNDDLVNIDGCYYLIGQSDIIQCEECNEWFVADDISHSENLNMELCNNCWDTAHERMGYVLNDDDEYVEEETGNTEK